ncbi:MAG: alpha/beta fold hydrolase [Alphaproteobacteria bacterium]
MADPSLLFDEPASADALLVLAHGAGAPMDTPFMSGMAARLAARGIAVARFDFPYMATRRSEGRRRPPDREPALRAAFWAAIEAARTDRSRRRLLVGGKSMGGRIASMIADEGQARGVPVDGVACLGYPFHPPGRPEKVRTGHLENQRTPTLIVQGTRDSFGVPAEVAGYALSPAVQLHWIEGGDHSLDPLKRSGRTADACRDEAADAVAGFVRAL